MIVPLYYRSTKKISKTLEWLEELPSVPDYFSLQEGTASIADVGLNRTVCAVSSWDSIKGLDLNEDVSDVGLGYIVDNI